MAFKRWTAISRANDCDARSSQTLSNRAHGCGENAPSFWQMDAAGTIRRPPVRAGAFLSQGIATVGATKDRGGTIYQSKHVIGRGRDRIVLKQKVGRLAAFSGEGDEYRIERADPHEG